MRPRVASKTPLAVAGILATPLFFMGLMALSLALEKPTITSDGSDAVLGDPSTKTETAIWLLALSAGAAIVAATTLLVPLGGWADEHTGRYPDGLDLIPKDDPSDLLLRGEWEENARRTAEQLGGWTIGIAAFAILLAVASHARRGRRRPVPPPPPEIAGQPPVSVGGR